jgi:hypothetical protein
MDLSVRASEQRRVNQPLDVTFQNEITGTMTRYRIGGFLLLKITTGG